jgi:hypothetical protein
MVTKLVTHNARNLGTQESGTYTFTFKYYQIHRGGTLVQVFQNGVKIKEISCTVVGVRTQITQSYSSGVFPTTIKTDGTTGTCAILHDFINVKA